MIIKQYIITLPAEFDMAIIRERVRKKGPAFDTFPGLGLKAFMIREKGRFGAENNQYAPVYLWPSVEAIWGFIAGEGFDGILQSFGWTPVYNWLGLVFAQTDQADALHQLQSVTREEQRIVAGTDLAALRNREIADARRTIDSTPGLLMRAVGINPETWSLVRFDYWSRRQDALPEGVHNYEVLHISAPNLETLKGYGSGSSDGRELRGKD